jgi:hypothetical protein
MEARMTALDRLIPNPRLVDIHRVDLAAPAEQVWHRVRHAALPHSPTTRALFALRTVIDREDAAKGSSGLRLDDMESSVERPGFRILVDDSPREIAVGAIGQVWRLRIPFVHVGDAQAFHAFSTPGYVKVAWAIRVSPLGPTGSHLELEVRVSATDDASWRKFTRYFRLIGPASRFIRRSLLGALAREFGRPSGSDEARILPGDNRLPDARAQMTHRIDIAATAETIWPWLVQMGGRRAGFYSIDALDNGGARSAREIHPEWQDLAVGDVLPSTPRQAAGFEVLAVDPPRTLLLGGLFDPVSMRQLAFSSARPERFWHMTWAFVLEPLGARSTRVTVRVRGAFSRRERARALGMHLIHPIMETAQLRHLAARAEGRQRRDDWRDISEGVVGVARMAFSLATPFLRGRRARWGAEPESATQALPGDDLVAAPRWSWTHGIEIDAPPSAVWPWVAQVGADRGGFYSYQWLENLAGCRLRNAETIHPEWALNAGQALVLHPDAPPFPVAVDRGRYLIAHAPAPSDAKANGRPWVEASWLFLIEPSGSGRSRFVSRYRVAYSDDLRTRLSFGPALIEPIGSEMDRRMLLGVKARVERACAAPA